MPIWRLSDLAKADIINLLTRTEESFGDTARRRYEILLSCGFRDVSANLHPIGSTSRPELGTGVRTYHLRHSRDHARTIEGFVRRPRYLLLYRAIRPDLIGIGRVLHDSMEPEQHLPLLYGDE